MRVNVELYDTTGKILHGKGAVEYEKIAETQVIERNGHTYVYQVSSRVNIAIFHEVKIPYRITEF